MAWYISKIVFQIVIDEKPTSQFDEQIRLLEADNIGQAFLKAQEIGLSEQETFLSADQRLCKWTYIGTTHLNKLNNLKDGVQFFSLTNEAEEADTYVNFVMERTKMFGTEIRKKSHFITV
jgi:Domain of unknown function (DUF4288)